MALTQATAGNRIVITDVNQFYNILKGVSGSGESITLIYNAAGVVILQPSSDPAAGTELIQIKNNAGTVQSALSSDGRFYAADGLVGTPGITFEADKDTGVYRPAANDLGFSVGGVIKMDLTATTFTVVPDSVFSNTISVGNVPATAGTFRLPSAGTIQSRNNANGGNEILMRYTSSDVIELGGGAGSTVLAAGSLTVTGLTLTAATATGSAGLRLPHGTLPSSPVNGDVWTTTAGLFCRINGVTKTVTLT